MMTDRTATTVLTGLGSLLGHHGGDYLVQLDCDAQRKQQRTRAGRISLARHAATYAATQAVTRVGLYRLAGHRVHPIAQLAGATVEGVAHALIDDGRALAAFARATGKQGFHDHAGAGCPGGSGRALLDQAAHQQIQIPAGIAATVLANAWLGRTR